MFPTHTVHPTPLRLGFSYIFLTSQGKYAGETYRLTLPLHIGKLGGQACLLCCFGNTWFGDPESNSMNRQIKDRPNF